MPRSRFRRYWTIAGALLRIAGVGWGLGIPIGVFGGEILPTVLVLASDDSQSRLEAEQIEGLRAMLSPGTDLLIDYLDVKRMSFQKYYLERYEAVLHGKYKFRKPNVVVALNDEAIRVLGFYSRTNLFSGVSIVVCGSQPGQAAELLNHEEEWTGVFSEPDLSATIDLALNLHPNIQKIHLLTGCSSQGLLHRARVKKEMAAGRFPRPTFIPGKKKQGRGIWGVKEIETYLQFRGKDDLIVFSEFLPELRGREFLSGQLIQSLSSRSISPIYATQTDAIGRGAIGGHVVNGRRTGQAVGALVQQVLDGQAPSSIPHVTVPGEWLFDHHQLKRWKISAGDLPADSRILNRPFAEIRKYKWVILGGSGVMLFELLIIFQLGISRYRRLRMMRTLQASEARYRSLYETAQDIFLIVDSAGVLVHANPAACQYLQYTREELCGQTVDQRVAEHDRQRFQAHLHRSATGGRALGEVRFLARDGSLVEVEVYGHPCEFNGKPAVVCSAHPLSEKLKLQRMAQEISERERQALGYDIHDGLGPYASALQMQCHVLKEKAERHEPVDFESVSKWTKIAEGLTTEVRDMARSLVPLSMVDRTLESALQELITINQRIFKVQTEMEFTLDESRMSTATAAQLYRIAQEHLRNSIRHAGTLTARLVVRAVSKDGGELVMETDGHPFEAQPSRRAGLGLSIMEQRARIIGGSFVIQPVAGQGTQACCQFPLMPSIQP